MVNSGLKMTESLIFVYKSQNFSAQYTIIHKTQYTNTIHTNTGTDFESNFYAETDSGVRNHVCVTEHSENGRKRQQQPVTDWLRLQHWLLLQKKSLFFFKAFLIFDDK